MAEAICEIVMRVYFEKPRTTVGWKGLINDPDLDGSFDIDKGLRMARNVLLDRQQSRPAGGDEFLDMTTPQYIADLVSLGRDRRAHHREPDPSRACLGPLLPGRLQERHRRQSQSRAEACEIRRPAASFHGGDQGRRSGIATTTGNEDCHIILRGGTLGTNYDAQSVEAASAAMTKAGLRPEIMIDFSHANSSKQHKRQIVVAQDVGGQVAGGDRRIIGVMVESHLFEGRQEIAPKGQMKYGQSVTDACIGWEDTVEVLRVLSSSVAARRERLAKSA
jgi:3-deoxy-7-phosphoheptulonate synthase